MISIVICHYNREYLNKFKKSVAEFIGVKYELVVIDNTINNFNIFEAYNHGYKKCIYDIICFSHEDILFHTHNWGKKVITHFNDPKVGIIGVVGSHYLPKIPGGHWSTGINSGHVLHTINGKQEFATWRYNDVNGQSLKAVLLDGLWLCISRDVMNQVSFDDSSFSGFHCYDSDICMQVHDLKRDALIVFDINIEHFSLGIRNEEWLKNIFLFYKKWKNKLPVNTIEISENKRF
jgi:glycosyltransferase involved in cell wall biosynthesis